MRIMIFLFMLPMLSAASLADTLEVRWGRNNVASSQVFHVWYEKHGDTLLHRVSGDHDASYWCANFLCTDYYLHGTKPNYRLAVMLLTQSIGGLLGSEEDMDALADQARARMVRLVAAHKIELKTVCLADAQWIRDHEERLAAMWPSMSPEDRAILDSYVVKDL